MGERSGNIEERLRDVEGRVDTHEAICAERYKQIVDGSKALAEEVKSTNALIRIIGLMLVGGMAGVIISQVMP